MHSTAEAKSSSNMWWVCMWNEPLSFFLCASCNRKFVLVRNAKNNWFHLVLLLHSAMLQSVAAGNQHHWECWYELRVLRHPTFDKCVCHMWRESCHYFFFRFQCCGFGSPESSMLWFKSESWIWIIAVLYSVVLHCHCHYRLGVWGASPFLPVVSLSVPRTCGSLHRQYESPEKKS